jgi:hypothetical protein
MYESAISKMRRLASLKLTLLGIVALLIGVLLSYFSQDRSSVWIIIPLAVLTINLLAAIIFNPRIRQNSGLLMFHICLLMLAVLTLLSQLTSMKGRVEITQGTAFGADNVTVVQQGAWHSLGRLQQVEFVQGDIEVDYVAGLRRGPTRSQLQLSDDDMIVVGDNLAYNSHGYRFYTTSNKGFAAIVNWYAKDGGLEQGSIHFPSYPLYDWKQHNQWQAPSGEQLEFELLIETPLERDREWQLQGVKHGRLVVTLPGGSVHTLVPGDAIRLEHGVLEFDAIRMWMGYKIFYDPFLAWFFAAALVGVAGIAWHYRLKMSSPVNRRRLAADKVGRGGAVTTSHS